MAKKRNRAEEYKKAGINPDELKRMLNTARKQISRAHAAVPGIRLPKMPDLGKIKTAAGLKAAYNKVSGFLQSGAGSIPVVRARHAAELAERRQRDAQKRARGRYHDRLVEKLARLHAERRENLRESFERWSKFYGLPGGISDDELDRFIDYLDYKQSIAENKNWYIVNKAVQEFTELSEKKKDSNLEDELFQDLADYEAYKEDVAMRMQEQREKYGLSSDEVSYILGKGEKPRGRKKSK